MAVRILHVLGAMDPGGVETWLLHVLKYIARGRFRFHFCTCGPRLGLYAAEIEKLGGKMLRCPKDTNLWSFGRRFRRILRDGHYDVVHSHVHLFSGAVLRWAHAEGVPMRIAHSHNSLDEKSDTPARRYYRRVMKSWIDRYATHGLAASRPAAAALFGENWQSNGRVGILYCGIDLCPFQEPVVRDEVRRELGVPLDAPVVGHVGRFDPQKNHRFLLEIAAGILRKRREVHFLLVGDGPLRPQIEAQARTMGTLRNVRFLGIRCDVPRIMRGAMDVFVFPSRWEGLPVTLIEAQAAGLRCVVADTITNEAKILSEQFIQLPLSERCEEWAAKTVYALEGGRVQGDLPLRAIAESDFCIQRSSSLLSDLYSAGRGLS